MSHQRWAGVALLGGLLGLLLLQSLGATMKMKKDTGKKCVFCHTVVPEKGDKDPRLNRDGKLFKENGYKLTEEQKKRPG